MAPAPESINPAGYRQRLLILPGRSGHRDSVVAAIIRFALHADNGFAISRHSERQQFQHSLYNAGMSGNN